MQYLQLNKIQTAIHYPSLIAYTKAYSYLGHKTNDFPFAEKINKQILSIPIYPGLDLNSQDYIISKIKEFFN